MSFAGMVPTSGGTRGALAFARYLVERAASEPPPADYALPNHIPPEAERRFIGSTFEDVVAELELAADSNGRVGLRSTLYWLKHGRVVAGLMPAWAVTRERPETLCVQLGRIHDVDYLARPHTARDGRDNVHPTPLAHFLLERGVPTIHCTAVMEHAGYIGAGAHLISRGLMKWR